MLLNKFSSQHTMRLMASRGKRSIINNLSDRNTHLSPLKPTQRRRKFIVNISSTLRNIRLLHHLASTVSSAFTINSNFRTHHHRSLSYSTIIGHQESFLPVPVTLPITFRSFTTMTMSESGIREETVETTTSTQASQPKQLGKRSRADDEKSPPSSMRSSDSDVNDNGNNEPSVSVRVVSYNVLSSRLARADYFNHCDPSNLEAKVRLPRILQKIEDEMNRSSETTSSYTPPTIFCLQEVSR